MARRSNDVVMSKQAGMALVAALVLALAAGIAALVLSPGAGAGSLAIKPAGAALVAGLGAAASASPPERVKAFLTEFNSAINDPGLADASRQRAWVDALAAYFQPAQQSQQKQVLASGLANIGAGRGGIKMSIENVATALVTSSGTDASVKITGGTVMFVSAQSTERKSLAQAGLLGPTDTVNLKQIGGVWYLVGDQ